MKFKQRESGLLVPEEPKVIDLGKEIDKRFTQLERKKYLGLKKEKGIYVPNQYAVKQPSMFKKIAAAITLFLSSYLTGCATTDMSLADIPLTPDTKLSAPEKPGKEKPEENKERKLTGEFKIFQLYNLKDEYGFTRVELSGDLPGGIEAWAFTETDGKGYFAFTTLDRKLIEPFYIGLEHTSSDAFKDFTKAGIVAKGDVAEGLFVKGKVMQKLGPNSDTTLGALVAYDVTDWLTFEALYERDIRAGIFYAESSLILKPFLKTDFEGLDFLIQGRSGGSIHRSDHEGREIPVDIFIGFRYQP